MRTIRASEIGTFLYCRRAWSYEQKRIPSDNQTELASGKEIHEKHSRTVLTTGCLRILAYFFLITALILITSYLIMWWI